MALSYLRHQLHLHRNKIVFSFLLALIGFAQEATAQGSIKVENLPGYEYKRLRWGFSLGMNASWYQLVHSDFYVKQIEEKRLNSVMNEKSGVGFNVNFITSYRLNSDLSLRAQPGVGYHSRVIEFKGNFTGAPEGGVKNQELNTFSAELPLLMKYESNRRKNTQMYFVAGVKPIYVVGGQKKGNDNLQVNPFDFSIEYGVGLDMFYPFFKFAPEIRVSRGISNIHKPANSVYNNSIQQLNTNTITLYLNFE